jgi:hypothetical protein
MDVVQIVFSRFPIDNRIISHHPFKKKQHPNCIPKNIDIPHKKPMVSYVSFRESHESADHGARRHTTAENASLAVSWGTKVEGLGKAAFFGGENA